MDNLFFGPFIKYPMGTVRSLLSRSYEAYAQIDTGCYRKWLSDWGEYDHELFAYPESVGACGFITSLHDRVIGMASWDPRQYPAGIIGHNCILPEYRQKGFGKRQIMEILKRSREAGFDRAIVSTGGQDFFIPARMMYRSCAFKEVGRRLDAANALIEYELTLAISENKDAFPA